MAQPGLLADGSQVITLLNVEAGGVLKERSIELDRRLDVGQGMVIRPGLCPKVFT